LNYNRNTGRAALLRRQGETAASSYHGYMIFGSAQNANTSLRRETTMTLKWIADRLKMGTWTHVADRLYHLKR
jgi:hypothetical protein